MFRKLTSFIVFQIFLLSFSISASSGQERMDIVVSIYPLKDIVEQVGGEKVRVDFVIPPGASPHTFEPKPSDINKLNRAKAIFLIGGGLEFWAEKVIRSLNKKPGVVILSKGLPLSKENHLHGKQEEIFDPHIWLDPVMVMSMVNSIRDTLIDLDPSNKNYYIKRAEGFKRELDGLHSRIKESVRGFRVKEFVTFHSAWNYFSRRYGLRVIGIIEESPGKEASPAHIVRIIEEIRKTKGKVVFIEPQFNPKAAEVIAKETGAKIFILDPIGNPRIKGRGSYIGLMNYNLSVFERALK
ncbi:MAG: metal ABC transporter substrate-binding protein [Thermodesulfovibrionales bacterium]